MPVDDESNKRKKILQEALELDRDEEEEDMGDEDGNESHEEDNTAELLRELEKIKRERVEEKARAERD